MKFIKEVGGVKEYQHRGFTVRLKKGTFAWNTVGLTSRRADLGGEYFFMPFDAIRLKRMLHKCERHIDKYDQDKYIECALDNRLPDIRLVQNRLLA